MLLTPHERRAGQEKALEALRAGDLRMVVDDVLPLAQINEAFQRLEQQTVRGKLLLRLLEQRSRPGERPAAKLEEPLAVGTKSRSSGSPIWSASSGSSARPMAELPAAILLASKLPTVQQGARASRRLEQLTSAGSASRPRRHQWRATEDRPTARVGDIPSGGRHDGAGHPHSWEKAGGHAA